MNAMRHVGQHINTYLISILITVGGWLGEESYRELRATHDAVLRMVPRDEFTIEITAIKIRLTSLELEVQNRTKSKP